MRNVTNTHWEVSLDESQRQNCFRVRWTAIVHTDSPYAAVTQVWCQFFRPSGQDVFTVYRPRTGGHSTHRAGAMLPELRRDPPATEVFIVTWDAYAFADHAEGALKAVLAAYFKGTGIGHLRGELRTIPAETRGRLQ